MKKDTRIIQINDINLGYNLKALRIAQHMKQTDVIAKLQLLGIEISIFSYSKIENGKQNPTVSLLVALTKVFNCDFNALFNKL